jgi:hypothetical protein
MNSKLAVSDAVVRAYWDMFINRLAYTLQSPTPHAETGRHYYYRPKRKEQSIPLSLDTVRRHLEGRLTIGLYAINPKTQKCRWVAIDADYENALEDLLKLQWELRQDGVDAALEKSRRGGHLWIFAQEPLLARDCRVYIYNLARRLKVPVKATGPADGIEIFPKQDQVSANEFGNALRGPLGVHQASKKRFWFYGADYVLVDQISYLGSLKRITQAEMAAFVRGLEMPPEFSPRKLEPTSFRPASNGSYREFRILDYVRVRRKMARNYWTQCPSCAQQGRDKSGDNLAISIGDPRKYRCWAGCSREQIRAALGCPIRHGPGRRADGSKYGS